MSDQQTTGLQRLILTSDGTVTPMLEQAAGESITTAKLEQSIEPVDARSRGLLGLDEDQPALVRTTELRGADSGQLYLAARSVIVLTALTAGLRADLLRTREPIGRLLRRYRVESYREIVSIDPPAPGRPVTAAREYRIFLAGRPAFLIGEVFHFGTLVDVLGTG